MTLSQLITYALEAQGRFGDIPVVILDDSGQNFFELVQLELLVAEVKLKQFKKPEMVFAFMAVQPEFKGDIQ